MTVTLSPLLARPMAATRLICVPFAGAGPSVFSSWVKDLPPHLDVFCLHLPGRETRVREPFFENWEAMIDSAAAAIRTLPPISTVLFGHSLGALIVLDVGRRLTQDRYPLSGISVAGRPWPGSGALTKEVGDITGLPDAEFLAAMITRYGAVHESLSNPEIAEIVLPILRADLKLLQSYAHRKATPLPCPVTVFYGRDDPITEGSQPEDWAAESSARCDVHTLNAGHYFIDTHGADILQVLSARDQ